MDELALLGIGALDAEMSKLCHRRTTFLNVPPESFVGGQSPPFHLCVITRSVRGLIGFFDDSGVAYTKTNKYAKIRGIWGMGLEMNRLL